VRVVVRSPWRAAALSALLLAPGACHHDPPVQRRGPTPREEAAALLEQARRDVEQAPAEPKGSGAALQVPAAPPGPLPLLIFLHGLGGSGQELSRGLHLKEYSEQLGFAYLAPDGMLDGAGRRFWNASESCCNFDRRDVDHIGQLRGWIQSALQNPKLDARRVYLVGYSNGGFLAHRAACELGPLLRGIYSIGGAGPNPGQTCKPSRGPSIVEIHGDEDAIVSYAGGYLFGDRRRPQHPSSEATVRAWSKRNGCGAEPLPRTDLDLEPRIPGAETQVLAFPDCKGSPVELWRIRGGGHAAGLSRLTVLNIWENLQARG
jgi:polyhydroxybutyrate depolymerase